MSQPLLGQRVPLPAVGPGQGWRWSREHGASGSTDRACPDLGSILQPPSTTRVTTTTRGGPPSTAQAAPPCNGLKVISGTPMGTRTMLGDPWEEGAEAGTLGPKAPRVLLTHSCSAQAGLGASLRLLPLCPPWHCESPPPPITSRSPPGPLPGEPGGGAELRHGPLQLGPQHRLL